MRWPIQLQLLFPMLLVLVLAVALSSAAGAYLGGAWVRQQQRENLGRVVATLTDASFPLTENVLRKMSGLSGAEFLVFDADAAVVGATVSFSTDDLESVRHIEPDSGLDDLSASPTLSLGGRDYLSSRLPLGRHSASGRPGSLLVLYPKDRWWTATRQAVYPPLIAGAVAAIVAVMVTTMLGRRFVRPIKRLSIQVTAMSEGVFRQMPLAPRNDEVRDLTISINRMAAQLTHYEEQVRRSERLRTLGQLGAGMAHQLRNSVTGARMALEFHRRECPLGAGSESFDVALRQMSLMESYVQRFLRLGREPSVPHATICLDELIEDALSLLQPACRHGNIHLDWQRPSASLSIQGDGESLRQMVVNLLLNAVEAVSGASHGPGLSRADSIVRVRMEPESAGRIVLRISDSGCGPAAELSDRLFEPFVTDKPDGTGLGLSVARQVVQEHGGTIHWERFGGMTSFVVEFPVGSAECGMRNAE